MSRCVGFTHKIIDRDVQKNQFFVRKLMVNTSKCSILDLTLGQKHTAMLKKSAVSILLKFPSTCTWPHPFLQVYVQTSKSTSIGGADNTTLLSPTWLSIH